MSNKRINGYFLRVSEEGEHFKGYIAEFEDTLKYLQGYVGGCIDVVMLNDDIDLVINDCGKIDNLPANRVYLDAEGIAVDFICGNILCLRHDDEGDFDSILESDIPEIEKSLKPLLHVSAIGDKTIFIMTNTDNLPEYEETDK